MGRTIPEPTSTDVSIALTSLMMRAKDYELDTTNPDLHAFILDQVDVIAQLNAEVRFLRNMIHPK